MPYVRIWVHLVWSTKHRFPYLTDNIRDYVMQHIADNAVKKNIYLDCINGSYEHAHALISLKSDQTIAKVMQLIKGESSYWINRQSIIPHKFDWQNEYFGVSVSEANVDIVRRYIHNQTKHHKRKSFSDEYLEFIKRYGFDII